MEFLELEGQVKRLLADGRKISAVKLVRETTGWGLKQAKDFVDGMGKTEVGLLNPGELRGLVAAGRKVQAVKRVRDATGWGLKRAKDYVDALK